MTRNGTTVTAELDRTDSSLRRIIDDHAELLKQWRQQVISGTKDRPTLRPERASLGGMVGHAIDHRIRWWLSGVNDLDDSLAHGLAWCAERTRIDFLRAFAAVRGFPAGVLDAERDRALAAVAVAAASVEPLFRAGPAVPCALQELGMDAFLAAYRDVVDDVVQLGAGLPALLAAYEGKRVETGPDVRIGRLAGDADLLVGTELVEIKCTVNPRAVATAAARQILVYAARLRAETAALILPRQGCRLVFDLSSIGRVLERIDSRIVEAYGDSGT
jgi:hypothetical protein